MLSDTLAPASFVPVMTLPSSPMLIASLSAITLITANAGAAVSIVTWLAKVRLVVFLAASSAVTTTAVSPVSPACTT